MNLYPYQVDAIKALWRFWHDTPQGAPLLVCPTGSGKSFICASIISQITAKYPRFRFLIVTHTKEIVSQNSKELQAVMPQEPIGIYSAGLGQKRIKRITFANVQSIYKAARDLHVDLLIIDEAHLVPRDADTMYQKLVTALQAKNYRMRICGLTATPMRMDQGSLIAAGSTFTDIAYDISIRRLIDEGFLAPLVSMAKKAVDLSGVRSNGWDYNQGEMQAEFNKAALVTSHVKSIIEAAGERKHWLVFCSGIEHAAAVSAELNAQGVPADFVTGEMMTMQRDTVIANFKAGKIRALCNVNVLTTGFNFRPIDCIALLRSTKSASLYVQTVGRGTRTAEGKADCLVLDFGGNIERHGPIDCIAVKHKKEKSKAEITIVPFKKCPMCGCAVPIAVRVCPSCQYPYPEPTQNLETEASAAPVLSAVELLDIDYSEIRRHHKLGKPDSMRIDYHVGMRLFSQFLCFDHGGFATKMANGKWYQLTGIVGGYPQSVDEALARQKELLPVKQVRVIKRPDKHYEILSVVTMPRDEARRLEMEKQAQWEADNPF